MRLSVLKLLVSLIVALLPMLAGASRYEDFNEHNQLQVQFEKERLAGYEEFLATRQSQTEEIERQREQFMANSKKQITIPELSENYDIYLIEKSQRGQAREANRVDYLALLDLLKKKRTGALELPEETEYALTDNEAQRVEPSKRQVRMGQGSRGRGYAPPSSSGGGGGGSFGREPIRDDFPVPPREDIDEFDDAEPPPPPPAPEFEEGEVVPPPPPPEGSDF